MVYRGEDLDLRTPQTAGAPVAETAGEGAARGGFRNGPILVDDVVLACSNHAYDIALAHRAGEVRVEHLIYALTRIDTAIDALEARGVRLSSLRRDAAALVASEIPVGLPNGKGSPRRSDDFAEVLRLASANAGRRNAPANVDDVLSVLVDQRPDITGAVLLNRHLGRGSLREPIEPLPPLTRYAQEPRYVRVPYEAPRYYVEAPPRGYRSEFAGSATDAAQNTRIEALEQMVRSLSNDLAGERQVLSGLLKDLSRETQAQRDDQGRMHTGMFDRMQTIEQAVSQMRGINAPDALVQQLQNIETGLELRLQDMSQSWAVLSARLQDLEAAIRDGAVAGGTDLRPIAHRLDVIEEAVLSRDGGGGANGELFDRLTALESEITKALAANVASANRVESLVMGLERNEDGSAISFTGSAGGILQYLEDSTGSLNRLGTDIGERLGAVERALTAEIETAAAKHQAYAHDLSEVHEALMKLNQNQHTLAGSIDQWRTDAAGDVAMISNRLNHLDRDSGRSGELSALSSRMDAISKTMVERYHRRNRFWYWLFGTDDWIGASWPSQAAAIEAEKVRLKG